MKRVRSTPMTIAERHYIPETTITPSTIPEDLAIIELQLKLASADNQPLHEELTLLMPDPQKDHNQQANILAPPSDFSVQSPSQSLLDTYLKAHQTWFV
jgi:hypothetical protein